jgi:methylated-DNA-protein-cysteine methyltransferase related protein
MIDNTMTFSERVKMIIRGIPKGKVASYGQIAAYAGNPLGAKQVAYVLHASSKKDKLPWQRVINGKGKISLPVGAGYETQKRLLRREGVKFGPDDVIDFEIYQWNPIKIVKRHRASTRKTT